MNVTKKIYKIGDNTIVTGWMCGNSHWFVAVRRVYDDKEFSYGFRVDENFTLEIFMDKFLKLIDIVDSQIENYIKSKILKKKDGDK